MVPSVLAAAGALAGAAYLNARLSLADDLVFFGVTGSVLRQVSRAIRADKLNFFYLLEERALNKTTAGRPFIVFEGKSYTYADTYDKVLRFGAWLRERRGVQPRDIVALNYQNSETFVFLWFALWAIGAKAAFINYHLQGAVLAHSLQASTAKLVIVDPSVAGNVTEEVREALPGTNFLVFSPEAEEEVRNTEPVRYPDAVRSESDRVAMAILIYTSGTTGMPKPAVLSWARLYLASMMAAKGAGLRPDDVFYTCMPLYHTSASCVGVCGVLVAGASAAIGRRFSTKTFWKEVRAANATVIHYVGETGRYLTTAPPEIDPATGANLDRAHRVRLAVGHGLRPDVWERFRDRFGIDTIFELYAATDGTLGFWNRCRNSFGTGAVGRYGFFSSAFLQRRSAIVRVDNETDLPWRDPKTGLCQRVKTGEVGEFLVLLPADDIKQAFQGYLGNQKATESKILRDVFRKGDAWFRSGDLMQWDTDGRLYFIDRIGDTFRWKSENVSTTEVSQALGLHPAVLEANVYGVQLPHHDGRAGCVAIVLDSPHPPRPELLASLAAHARETLPRYAVPLFLRLLKDVGMQNTGTHKQQKHVLRQQGVDPAKVQGDALFWLKDGTYVPFGEREWRALQQAAVKL
ncbi:uncharacterized protein THITE_2141752 [Thermothielavioides terrestris NRRL 8126]|uniref:Very long-chain fatty acid transport protein n=1 Tax=Thermothielavioides terrestris (strain ATCC 38088 / NRRL 8126) TaxID=578455 RepID=G2QUE7_THETT|nr:uncharacterized protein THITE_2141752 [Thermothielavioides terrestris NRRL 8126]AEO63699.1 hypothetical protein THITE_2141752 [Thermothielavioides terrestris NRRL 8126]